MEGNGGLGQGETALGGSVRRGPASRADTFPAVKRIKPPGGSPACLPDDAHLGPCRERRGQKTPVPTVYLASSITYSTGGARWAMVPREGHRI